MNIKEICEHLRSVVSSEELYRLEDALLVTGKQAARLFQSMSANDVFSYRDARKAVQSRLNRLRAARKIKAP